MINGQQVYMCYLAVRTHFTSENYNYFHYKGKVFFKPETYQKHKHKSIFEKLGYLYKEDELPNLFAATWVKDESSIWPGIFLEDQAKARYYEQQKYLLSGTYFFRKDLDILFKEYDNKDRHWKNIFRVNHDGSYPPILWETISENIHCETLCILNGIMNLFNIWNNSISDTFLWPGIKMRMEKYTPFLSHDKKIFSDILKEKINSNG
jgi:hypothetical protein